MFYRMHTDNNFGDADAEALATGIEVSARSESSNNLVDSVHLLHDTIQYNIRLFWDDRTQLNTQK